MFFTFSRPEVNILKNKELLDARAAVTAMINADIFEHPKLRDYLMAIPRFL